MNTSLVHSELTLLTKASRAKLAREPLLDVGMDPDVMTGEIIPTGEFFRTRGTLKTSLSLMFDNVMLCECILAGEAFAASRVFARKASSTREIMHLCDVTFEFASSAKGTCAKWTNQLGRRTGGSYDEREELERVGSFGSSAATVCPTRGCLTCESDGEVGIISWRCRWGWRH